MFITRNSHLVLIIAAIVLATIGQEHARADIFRWDNDQLIAGTKGVIVQPGVNLSGRSTDALNLNYAHLIGDMSTARFDSSWLRSALFSNANLTGANLSGADLSGASLRFVVLAGANLTGATVTDVNFEHAVSLGFTKHQLYATASYQRKSLKGISIGDNDLSGWDFSGQDLTNASFGAATLTGADFTGAIVAGAHFHYATSTGFTKEQLYSTASYHQKNMQGMGLTANDYSGWDFSGQNLMNSNFEDTNLTNTNLTGADGRGTHELYFANAIARNAIASNGSIAGLDLLDGDRLVVRDDDGDSRQYNRRPPIPIKVFDHMSMAAGGTLQLALEADEWNSTISFESGIPVTLGGVLELTFAGDTNVASQIGRTFTAFNWTGVAPIGEFRIESPYIWDTSKLYTTGEVTLTAVPEPSGAILVLAAMPLAVVACRWLGRCGIRNRLASRTHSRTSL